MPISVICPSCGTKLNAPDQHAGKRGKCPKCQATVELAPAPSAPLNTDMAEGFRVADLPTPRGLPVEAVPASVPGPVPEAGERRKRRKKKPKGFLGRLALPAVSIEPGLIKIALGMAAVLSLGFAGYYGLRSAFRVPPPPVIAAEKWQPLEIAGRFKVLLPGAAQPLTQTAAGMQMTFYNYQPDKDSVYSVAYMHEVLPPPRRGLPVETLLNDACDGAIANTKSQGSVEVSRRSIQLGSFEGKELIAEIPRVSAKMITRVYAVHGRLYLVMAGGIGLEADHANVKRLFESFAILDGTPPESTPAQPPAGQPASIPAQPPASTVPPVSSDTPKQAEPPPGVTQPDQTGNLLVNGSFEEGPEPTGEGSMPLEKGSTAIKGWTVTRGQIDYVGHFWQAAHGKRSLDLDGNVRGGIEQTFRTRKGQKYRVKFSMAGNPHPIEREPVKKLGVRAGDKSAEFEFNTTGKTNKDMGWVTRTWEFTAVAEQTPLEFYSLSGQLCGPTLDNVSVVEIRDQERLK